MKIEIKAKERKSKGTGASRRLRHEGTTPGILYGGVKDAISLEIDTKESVSYTHLTLPTIVDV